MFTFFCSIRLAIAFAAGLVRPCLGPRLGLVESRHRCPSGFASAFVASEPGLACRTYQGISCPFTADVATRSSCRRTPLRTEPEPMIKLKHRRQTGSTRTSDSAFAVEMNCPLHLLLTIGLGLD